MTNLYGNNKCDERADPFATIVATFADLGIVHEWRHSRMGRGSIILRWQLFLKSKTKICSNLHATPFMNEHIDAMPTNKATILKFINELHLPIRYQFHQHIYTQIYARRSRKRKKTDVLTVFFTLLGSARIKAVGRMLMKSTQGINFINILWTAFAQVVYTDPTGAHCTA